MASTRIVETMRDQQQSALAGREQRRPESRNGSVREILEIIRNGRGFLTTRTCSPQAGRVRPACASG
jgi:hypothetical protein